MSSTTRKCVRIASNPTPSSYYTGNSDPSTPRSAKIDPSLHLTPEDASDDSADLPEHPHSTGSFLPTQKFQIQAHGKALWDFPTPGSLDPIPVFDVTDGRDVQPGDMPMYISSRSPERTRTTQLIKTAGAGLNSTEVARTIYTFALARTPKIELLNTKVSAAPTPLATPGTEAVAFSIDPAVSVIADTAAASASSDSSAPTTHEILVQNKKLLHRSTVMRTHLGTFEWRYANKKERHAETSGADSLLIFERVAKVVGDAGKTDEIRMLVGRLVRSDETRTPGTGATTAGNGGLLVLDLREWAENKHDMEAMRVLAITSCLTMLKKEVDRRRAHQIMVLSGGGGVVVL